MPAIDKARFAGASGREHQRLKVMMQELLERTDYEVCGVTAESDPEADIDLRPNCFVRKGGCAAAQTSLTGHNCCAADNACRVFKASEFAVSISESELGHALLGQRVARLSTPISGVHRRCR
jgi:hypothetical protein